MISGFHTLTHWGRVTHICVSKLTFIGSDNGLSPDRRQAIIWTNAGLLLIGPLGTNFSEILIAFHTFSFKKMLLKMSFAKWRPFYLGLNVLSDGHEYMQPIQVCVKATRTPNEIALKSQKQPLSMFMIRKYKSHHTMYDLSSLRLLKVHCMQHV